MTKKNLIPKISFMVILVLVSASLCFSQVKTWFYDVYDAANDQAEKNIGSRIQYGWYPAGLDFDGTNIFTLFTRFFPYKILKINQWYIDSADPKKEDILTMLNKNIEAGYIPANLAVMESLFMVNFIKYDDQPKITAFNVGIYPYDPENREKSYQLVSLQVNEVLDKGYIINGFSMDSTNYYFIFTKSEAPLQIYSWGIDWVLFSNYSFGNYMVSIEQEGKKIIDMDNNEEFIGILWIK